MPQVPVHERPPGGLKMPWLQVWRNALRELKSLHVWGPTVRPLLDEYVYALRGAADAREGFGWLDHLEDAVAEDAIDFRSLTLIATGLPTQWDKHAKRASALADQLGLTHRGRKVAGIGQTADVQPADDFAALDELAPRRAAR